MDRYSFLIDQFTPVTLLERDLTGKTVVVTGSNIGLGFEAAKHLASMNPEKLILAVRDLKKGQAAKDSIEAATKYSNIEVWKLDLSSFASVKEFVKKFEDSNQSLDILVSNAAIATHKWSTTADGWESTLQVNHLSNTLMILLLIPILRKTAKAHNSEPRVVVISSEVHFIPKFAERKESNILDSLNDQSRTDMTERYPVSKLLNIYMTRRIAALYPDISIHAVNPGLCHSELAREITGLRGIVFGVFKKLVARSTEVGSRTLVYGAISDDLALKNGPSARYWTTNREMAPSVFARDKKLELAVWNETCAILLKQSPELKAILNS